MKKTTIMLVFQFLKIYYMPCISAVTTAWHTLEQAYYFASSVSNQVKLITVRDRPLQLASPNKLSLVELLSGYRWGSSDPHIVFTMFMYLFVFEMQRLSLFS